MPLLISHAKHLNENFNVAELSEMILRSLYQFNSIWLAWKLCRCPKFIKKKTRCQKHSIPFFIFLFWCSFLLWHVLFEEYWYLARIEDTCLASSRPLPGRRPHTPGPAGLPSYGTNTSIVASVKGVLGQGTGHHFFTLPICSNRNILISIRILRSVSGLRIWILLRP